MLVMIALRRLRQEDHHEFQIILSYIIRPYIKATITKIYYKN